MPIFSRGAAVSRVRCRVRRAETLLKRPPTGGRKHGEEV